MSMAHKCDRCGVLYPNQKGIVAFKYSVDTNDKGEGEQFDGVNGEEYLELCPACSKAFLECVRHKP